MNKQTEIERESLSRFQLLLDWVVRAFSTAREVVRLVEMNQFMSFFADCTKSRQQNVDEIELKTDIVVVHLIVYLDDVSCLQMMHDDDDFLILIVVVEEAVKVLVESRILRCAQRFMISATRNFVSSTIDLLQHTSIQSNDHVSSLSDDDALSQHQTALTFNAAIHLISDSDRIDLAKEIISRAQSLHAVD